MLYGARIIVVFYETFRSNHSYTRLGHVEDADGLRVVLSPGKSGALLLVQVTATASVSGIDAIYLP